MTRQELEKLASEKDTTPENLLALINDQWYFENVFLSPVVREPLRLMREKSTFNDRPTGE